jgi:hypothetical protein
LPDGNRAPRRNPGGFAARIGQLSHAADRIGEVVKLITAMRDRIGVGSGSELGAVSGAREQSSAQ